MQRVGQPLLAGPPAGGPGDLPRPKGENRQRSPHSERALSSRSACYVRGRWASPPPLAERGQPSHVPACSIPGGRAVSAPHAQSGLTPPVLLDTPAAGGRHLLCSVEAPDCL
ncbi:hypothetical protein NDU88_002588 [Pleurodeles waltl]|uniref:Uncharacterized protein n=1 Tax=Pleurodeles waltl TaxID=8319 RepID=A0AAV7P7D6_PLEWA|nr:hypothetical protein NDU88_002588 [Pleurodeles waltl]